MNHVPDGAAEESRDLPDDFPTGFALLANPLLNRGTGFTRAEREAFDLCGLLPTRVLSMEHHAARILENFHKKPTDLEKYVHLIDLEDRNRTLFYRILIDNMEEMMPIVYTPTVGQACQQYGHIFRRPRGLFLSPGNGSIADQLRNWPTDDIRVIVVTDGERILGLGDLGANGMGIPVGKLSLYTACAGIPPSMTLPVMLDVGTENEAFLNDPLYIGRQERRLSGQAYDDFVEEFMVAVTERFPNVLVQFEDFANHHAFALLERYRDRFRVFNDDIQGTASVTLAGLLAALRLIEKEEGGPARKLSEQRLLFLGAGEAGVGIADLVVEAMMKEGVSADEARRRCWFVDSRGLVVAGRDDLQAHKRPYAHDHEGLSDLEAAVEELRPTILIGVSGQPRTFTRPIIEKMAKYNQRPIIFALSNPTSKSECTAEEAYTYSGGRAIFASGSPFPSFKLYGKTYNPGQGNNSYIFPGVGLGVVVSGARRVTDEMFEAAAETLAAQVTAEDMAAGRIYPQLSRIREVSAAIGTAVAEIAYREGLATQPEPEDLARYVREFMYDPQYTPLV